MWYQEHGGEPQPLRRESWEGVVIRVNYYTRRLAVNVTRTAGPRQVRILSSIDIGTSAEPVVKVGDRVLLVRNHHNEYVAIQHFPR